MISTARVVATLSVCIASSAPRLAADETCWAPDRLQAPDSAVARSAPVAALGEDVAAVSAILKRNAALLQIPKTRLMVSSFIGYANPDFGNAVRISAGLYPPNTWREGCTLMEGPEFFNSGHVHVTFNEPRQVFDDVSPRLQDDVLIAYAEPTGGVAIGEETYHPAIRGVVLTPGRVPAWVPVTRERHLAFREREAQAEIETIEGMARVIDSAVAAYRAEMETQIAQTTDAATQASLREAMEENAAMLQSGTADARGQYDALLAAAQAKLDLVRADRAELSSAQLTEQASLDGTPLVEINPALAGRRGRVNLIVVNSSANDLAMKEPLDRAVRAVDFAALRALLR